MLEMDVIEPDQTEWAWPIIFALKTDGTFQLCADYRKFNAGTGRDSYPTPRVDTCIDSLEDATILSALDGNSRYLQVEIAKANGAKTVFV